MIGILALHFLLGLYIKEVPLPVKYIIWQILLRVERTAGRSRYKWLQKDPVKMHF